MAEEISIERGAPKALKYNQLIPQVEALVGNDEDEVAIMANVAAALHHAFNFFWTGFYRVSNNQLVLGPFQGPVACMKIDFGKGVCGKAWEEQKMIIVPDVDRFPGHIACSAESRSEIVVPLIDRNGKMKALLDIDSASLNTFDHVDGEYLRKLCDYLAVKIYG